MTNKEAIDVIKCLAWHTRPNEEDIEQAIRALEQEPCGDCISREAVLDCFKKWQPYMATRLLDFEKELSELPPVTPQPKVGEWLEKEVNSETAIMVWQSARCSVCDKYHTTPYMYYFSHYDYCPHCGAKMEVEE